MTPVEYELGMDVWVSGVENGKLTKGKIVHKFQLDWGLMQYVIEIDTPVDPILLVRTWATVSEDGHELNIWRCVKGRANV